MPKAVHEYLTLKLFSKACEVNTFSDSRTTVFSDIIKNKPKYFDACRDTDYDKTFYLFGHSFKELCQGNKEYIAQIYLKLPNKLTSYPENTL